MSDELEQGQQEEEQVPEVTDSAPASALILIDAYKAAGTQPLTPEEAAILLAPIEEQEISLHPVLGPVVGWFPYVQRLNRAFGLAGWSRLRMGNPEFDPDRKATSIRVCLKVQGRIIRDAVGEYRQSGSMSPLDCLEAAMKNGLKRCCSDFGMFAELKDDRWKAQWLADHAQRGEEKRTDGTTYRGWQWKIGASTTEKKADLPKTEDLQLALGIVQKVEGPNKTGAFIVTIESEFGSVDVIAKETLSKYPDPKSLEGLWVKYRIKVVPQKGGGKLTVFDHFEVTEQP